MIRTPRSRRFPSFFCSVLVRVTAILAASGVVLWSSAKELEDFAQIYVDQFFEPPIGMSLSENAEKKAEALAHFTVGRMLENKDQPDQAIASYLKVLELQPGQLSLSRKCAYLLARSGKQAKGKELLESTLERNQALAFPFVMLSEFLSTYHSNNQDNKDRALSLAKEAVAKFPDDPITYEHLAKMYLLGKRRDDAKLLLSEALDNTTTDSQYWLRLGKVALRVWPIRIGVESDSEELKMLNRFYDKANQFAGNDDEVREKAGDYYLTTRQFSKAESIYQKLVNRRTDRLDLRHKLARVYKEQGASEKYLQTLLGIVEINPGDVRTHREIATAYKEKGDINNSVKHQRIALKIGKGSAIEYLRVAQTMVGADLHEESVEFLKEAAYLFPDNPDFHWLITFPLRSLKQFKEATKYFESCEKIAKKERPDMLNERFYFQMAATIERDGDIERAAKMFQKTIELLGKKHNQHEDKEFTATVYNYLGYMWIENDMKIDEAGELIKTAVDLDPESGAIADSLGWFYFKKGRYEEAKTELLRSERLLEENGDEPDAVILDHIGQNYYALGDKKKAIEYMERAVKLDPENKEFIERLARYRADNPPLPPPPAKEKNKPVI